MKGLNKIPCKTDLGGIFYEGKIYPDHFEVRVDAKNNIEYLNYSIYRLQKIHPKGYRLYIYGEPTKFYLNLDSSSYNVSYFDSLINMHEDIKTNLDLTNSILTGSEAEDFSYARYVRSKVSKEDTLYIFDEAVREFVGIPENFFFERRKDSLRLKEELSGDSVSRYLFAHAAYQKYSVSKKYYYHFLFNKIFFDHYWGVKYLSEPNIHTAPIADFFSSTRYDITEKRASILKIGWTQKEMDAYLRMLKCMTKKD